LQGLFGKFKTITLGGVEQRKNPIEDGQFGNSAGGANARPLKDPATEAALKKAKEERKRIEDEEAPKWAATFKKWEAGVNDFPADLQKAQPAFVALAANIGPQAPGQPQPGGAPGDPAATAAKSQAPGTPPPADDKIVVPLPEPQKPDAYEAIN